MCFPYVCLSMPCALLLLSVSPPLTCSQSPGLFVLLVSPVFFECSLCIPPVSHCLPRLDCSLLSLVICCLCVCIYSPCILVSRCVFVIICYAGMFIVFPSVPSCFQRLALPPC